MIHRVIISTRTEDGKVIGVHHAEFNGTPTPIDVELVCQLVMADAFYAVATVHSGKDTSILYGMVVEADDNGE